MKPSSRVSLIAAAISVWLTVMFYGVNPYGRWWIYPLVAVILYIPIFGGAMHGEAVRKIVDGK